MAVKAKRKIDPSKIRKLHRLLKLGMVDLRKQERAKNSYVNMEWWLDRHDGECAACLAGSVLRFTCRHRGSLVSPSMDEQRWMFSLNSLRKGHVADAGAIIEVSASSRFNRDICDYSTDREAFWRDIEQLYRDLKEADI